jgi:hypothetical protein
LERVRQTYYFVSGFMYFGKDWDILGMITEMY